ncbi:hypothetical protein [Providencia manganoxydans]|uniref:hypothetical protein n=1 Tax=Providencia manganoxydans TaxID=2923283 RepID=UPI0034DD7198
MEKVPMLFQKRNKKVFLFLFSIFLPCHVYSDELINANYMSQIPTQSFNKNFYGAYPAPTGVVGPTVKGCTRWSGTSCDPDFISDVWGAEFFMPGGAFKLTINSVKPGGNDSSNKCYLRGAWGIETSSGTTPTLYSAAYGSMNQTASYNNWSAAPVVVITSPLIINKRCSEITEEWLLESGTELIIPASSRPIYANISDPARWGGAMGSPSGSKNTVAWLRAKADVYFHYTGLVCSTASISSSTCVQSRYTGTANIGKPGEMVPVTPIECNVEGGNIINLGSVAKNNYSGTFGRVDMSVLCSRDSTVSLQLINENISKSGIDIKMSINKQGIKQDIQVGSNQRTSFFIEAEIISIAPSTVPDSYEMNNVLLLSYN